MFPDIRNCTAFFENSYTSPACHSDTSSIKMKMSTADWWTQVTGENRSTRTERVPTPHFPSQIPMDRPGSRTTPLRLLTARTMAGPRPARLQEANSIALTDYQREPRLNVRSRFANRAQQTETPRQSFRARLYSTAFNDVFTANGTRWGQSLQSKTDPSLRLKDPKARSYLSSRKLPYCPKHFVFLVHSRSQPVSQLPNVSHEYY